MRILVLGGTVFLSREVATQAVAAGHEVVCAARGVSGRVPDGATLVRWDRTDPTVPEELAGQRFDAVVDVARMPSQVVPAVAAFPDAHWVFVSTINVYDDISTPGGRPGTLPLLAPRLDESDSGEDPEAYGARKVACEQAVRAGAASTTVIRPGLIVGPGDPSGRFSYWPSRLAAAVDSQPVLAPGTPEDPIQLIDVRDLAAWILECATRRRDGDFDGVGPVGPIGELLAEVAAGVGVEPDLTWVPQERLTALGVQPWSGPESVPLWLPRPEYDGLPAHDAAPSLAAGLTVRTVAETARDTLAWLRATPDAPITGIGREREAEVLRTPA